MAERGLSVDHVTIWRWVQRYAPILNQRILREMRHPNRSWRVDETYVKVAGNWAYLYRAVDSGGETIEFMLSPRRDLIAAKLFLRLALAGGPPPRVINVDGHPAYPTAVAELKQSGELGRGCRCRTSRSSSTLRKRSHDFFLMFGITSLRAGFFSMSSSSVAYSKHALMYVRICPTPDLQ